MLIFLFLSQKGLPWSRPWDDKGSQDVHEGRLLRSASMEVKRKARVGKGGKLSDGPDPGLFCGSHGELYTTSRHCLQLGWDWTFGHQNENASVGRWESKHSGFLLSWGHPQSELVGRVISCSTPASSGKCLHSWMGILQYVWIFKERVDTVQHSFNSKILIPSQLPTHWSNIK